MFSYKTVNSIPKTYMVAPADFDPKESIDDNEGFTLVHRRSSESVHHGEDVSKNGNHSSGPCPMPNSKGDGVKREK